MKQTAKILFLCILGILLTFSLSSAQLKGPLMVSDRWPECTDLFTWSRDIFRLDGVTDSSERDRAISFFNWLRLYNRLCEGAGGMAHAFEGAWGEEKSVRDLHKHLFVYGWGFCDTHFGAFDARYGYYLLEKDTPDARILDWEGVGDDRNVWANMKYTNRCRPFFEFPEKELERALWVKPKKVFESEAAWRAAGTEPEVVFRNRQYRMGTKFHDMRFSLPRGTTIERWWDNRMKKWYVPEKNKDMFLPEGRFYRVGASMVGGDGEKNDPNWKYMKPYLTRVPEGLGYPKYLEGDLSLGQAWGKISYNPVLSRGDQEELKLTGSGLETYPVSPYIRPSADTGEGEWILEFYSPYILVDGFISGELTGGKNDQLEIAFRSQVPKNRDISQDNQWLPWKTLASKPGRFLITLDRADAAEGESSFHSTYRWQLRIRLTSSTKRPDSAEEAAPAGVSDLDVVTYFETGIMSIPQIFDGENTVRFKVDDPAQVKGDLRVKYVWDTAEGEQSHEKLLSPRLFFKDNEAVYRIEAPGLERCKALIISYP